LIGCGLRLLFVAFTKDLTSNVVLHFAKITGFSVFKKIFDADFSLAE